MYVVKTFLYVYIQTTIVLVPFTVRHFKKFPFLIIFKCTVYCSQKHINNDVQSNDKENNKEYWG